MFVDNADFNKDRYKAIIDNMIDGFAYYKIVFDENNSPVDFMCIDVNQSYERLTGLKREDVVNKKISELFPDVEDMDPEWVNSGIRAALNCESINYNTYFKPIDKWLSCCFFSYEYGYFAEIFHDITESKISNEKLIKSEEKYRSIFSSVQDAIFIADAATGNIIDANTSACKIYGYTKYEIMQLNRIDFVVDTKKMFENIQNNIQHLCIYHKKKDGTIFPVDMHISECIYDEEQVRIIIVRDITDHKLVQDLKNELERNLTILNESKIYENLRTDFFANISHELRTPLNVILGSVQLVNLFLDDENKPIDITKLKKYPRIIQQNCFRLLRLINNLIDITKIDSGYLELNLENRNIVNIIEDITLSVAEYIQNKEINLIFDTETEERLLAVDSDMIERIMLNLLSNAIKFTQPGGSIYVNLYENDNNFVISIKDTGIGIPADKLDNIFNRFTQVDKSLTRSREGSGIGLSLVKSLVELHYGSIKAISSFGYGSEFIIKLPIKTITSEEKVYTEEEGINQTHVERIHIEFSDIYA